MCWRDQERGGGAGGCELTPSLSELRKDNARSARRNWGKALIIDGNAA